MGKFNIAVLAVNQLRDKLDMGMFSSPKQLRFMSNGKTIPGGNALIFNSFSLLELKQCGLVTTAEDKQNSPTIKKYGFDGIVTSCTSVKNKLFAPNVSIELVADFNTGFSDFWTSYHFLVKHKAIKTGAWNYLMSNPEVKIRVKDIENKFETEEEFRNMFNKAVDDTIKIHILDKYSPKVITDKQFKENLDESLSKSEEESEEESE
jgi:RecA/RadA recombinase